MPGQAEIFQLLGDAQQSFLYGEQETYARCMEQAGQAIEALGSPNQLLGEWVFVSRLPCMLSIDRFLQTLERAATLLDGPSKLPERIPLNNGADCMFMMLSPEPGQADANREKICRIVDLYIGLTDTGYGYDTLYDAELAYYRGELDRASILAHQTVFTARNTGQNALLMCAAKVLANVAKHRIDTEGWKYALGLLSDTAEQEDGDIICSGLATAARIEMLVVLGDYDSLPDWFRAGNLGMIPGSGPLNFRFRSRNRSINYFNLPLVLWSYTLYLLGMRQHERMRAVMELQQAFGVSENVMAYDLYFAQIEGLDALIRGDEAGAAEHFGHAIDIVVPDGLWLCIAEFSALSKGFVQELLRSRGQKGLQNIAEKYAGLFDGISALREGVKTETVLGSLTAREREIAMLAAQGLRNQEIARRLNVTEQTVKFHLSNVYAKLAISGRSRLAALVNDIMS